MRILNVGLIVIGLLAALLVAGALILPSVIKQQIESQGASAIGAEVNLDGVDLHYWPVGLTLSHLQITDPENVDNNLVEWQSASFSLNISPLFSNKIHIQQFGIEGLVFDSSRENAGKVTEKKPSEGMGIDYELPDVNDILASEKLETDKEYKALQQTFEAKKSAWTKRKAQLPDVNKLSEYQQELKTLTNKPIKNHQDLVAIQKSVRTLQQSIRHDRQAIKEAASQLTDDKNEMVTAIMLLKAAPVKDYEALTKKYGLHQQGLVNMSQLLFGEQVGAWVGRLVGHYEKLKPLFANSEAEPSDTESKAPTKPWQVEVTEGVIDMPQAKSTLQVALKEVTWPVEKPGNIDIKGSLFGLSDELKANVLLESSEPILATTQFELKHIPATQLVSAMNLQKGRLDAQGQVTLSGDNLNGKSQLQLKHLVLNEIGTHPLVAKAMQDVSEVNATALITGTTDSPIIKYHSDLDDSLKNAIQKAIHSKKSEFEAKLSRKLNDKMTGYLGTLEKDTHYLDNEVTSLNQLQGKFSELLKTKVDTKKNQAQDKIKNELNNQLNKALGRWNS
ncbi:MAG: TIGR03545 family protein [Cellvibrionales bacterium]|nr:TIGR03545 family protein [Cellvibrionales bacterium]